MNLQGLAELAMLIGLTATIWAGGRRDLYQGRRLHSGGQGEGGPSALSRKHPNVQTLEASGARLADYA